MAGQVVLGQAGAPPAKPAAPPPLSATEQWIKNVKNPARWFNWGADLRLRNEYFDNALAIAPENPITSVDNSLHEQDYFRFRARVWASLTPVTNLSLNTRLAAEPRVWMRPAGYTPQAAIGSGGDWRYGILDNVNVKWKDAFGVPLTITAGRQDILMGDPLNWWLMADGTPGDGSWTFFLDSIRATYQAPDIKTTFDVMYIYQNPRVNDWIPVFNNMRIDNGRDVYLTEQTEQGVVLYGSNKSIKNTQVDPYFIYKHDNRELAIGDSANIYTLGAKITGTPAPHWKYSVEGAYQFGDKEDSVRNQAGALVRDTRDLDAFGVNSSLSYLFKDKRNNQLSLVYEFLSGDDEKTNDRDEMFDILWGRWPRFSELYLYSWAQETRNRIGQCNNLHRPGVAWALSPIKNMNVNFMYNALFAHQKVATRSVTPVLFSSDGTFRGHYFQTFVKHKFSDHLSGHLWAEFVWKGDYYSTQDLMSFLRAEVLLTF